MGRSHLLDNYKQKGENSKLWEKLLLELKVESGNDPWVKNTIR